MPKKAPPKRAITLPRKPAKGRNEFGDPRDTLYAGGTPLFDETGRGAIKRPPTRKKPVR
jgi:hypothetical protein